ASRPLTPRGDSMPRPLAPLLAILLVSGTIEARVGSAADARAPRPDAPPSDFYLDWRAGWHTSRSVIGDLLSIALDPETGTWGPAPVDRALRTSGIVAPPLVLHRADGSIEVILDPSIVEYLVARIGPDGKPSFDCLPSDRMGGALAAPAASGPPDR